MEFCKFFVSHELQSCKVFKDVKDFCKGYKLEPACRISLIAKQLFLHFCFAKGLPSFIGLKNKKDTTVLPDECKWQKFTEKVKYLYTEIQWSNTIFVW